jgi:hypothetical protein
VERNGVTKIQNYYVMFDIDKNISAWRKEMKEAGIDNAATLDELESHVRQEFQTLTSAGHEPQPAFQLAIERLGTAPSVGKEFHKITRPAVSAPGLAWALWTVMVPGGGALIVAHCFLGVGSRSRDESHRWLSDPKASMIFYTHIFFVGVSYVTALLASFLGMLSVMSGRCRTAPQPWRRSWERDFLLFSRLTLWILIPGVLLGLFVSKGIYGSWWRWDPKEIWALIAVIWFFSPMALEFLGKMTERSMAVVSMVGGALVMFAWFGAGLIDAHPSISAYGVFAYWPLTFVLALHISIIAIGLFPKRCDTNGAGGMAG